MTTKSQIEIIYLKVIFFQNCHFKIIYLAIKYFISSEIQYLKTDFDFLQCLYRANLLLIQEQNDWNTFIKFYIFSSYTLRVFKLFLEWYLSLNLKKPS